MKGKEKGKKGITGGGVRGGARKIDCTIAKTPPAIDRSVTPFFSSILLTPLLPLLLSSPPLPPSPRFPLPSAMQFPLPRRVDFPSFLTLPVFFAWSVYFAYIATREPGSSS